MVNNEASPYFKTNSNNTGLVRGETKNMITYKRSKKEKTAGQRRAVLDRKIKQFLDGGGTIEVLPPTKQSFSRRVNTPTNTNTGGLADRVDQY